MTTKRSAPKCPNCGAGMVYRNQVYRCTGDGWGLSCGYAVVLEVRCARCGGVIEDHQGVVRVGDRVEHLDYSDCEVE